MKKHNKIIIATFSTLLLLIIATSCSNETANKQTDEDSSLALSDSNLQDSNENEGDTLRQDAMDSFSFQFEDSDGAYYIGNGQIIEYYDDSFASVVYAYKQATAYQAETLSSELDGRYIVASGQITGVDDDGKIEILCNDPEAAKEGVAFLPMGTARLSILEVQQNEMLGLNHGDTIVSIGRFDGQSRQGLFADTFDLYDGVIIAVNGIEREVPAIEKDIPGLTKYPNGETSAGYGENPSSAQGNYSYLADYIGDWYDTVSQSCFMTIEALDDNTCFIQINWSSSASGDSQWNMTGQYNSSTGELEYYDGTVFDYVYTEDDDIIEDLLYIEGTGKLYFSDGYLNWQDDTEQVGARCLFEKDSIVG